MNRSIESIDLQRQIRIEMVRNFFLNLVINAGFAFAVMRGNDVVEPWGGGGYILDVVLTGFLLPAILGCIFMFTYRAKRGNKHPALQRTEYRWFTIVPLNPWLAAPIIGVFGIAIAVPVLLVPIFLVGAPGFSAITYALLKGIWAAALAVVVVRISILSGLRRGSDAVE